ncbi:MAG: glycoside hydrolase [bacterium]|nr:glycoside hydrolase [bacterium]
MVFDIFYNRSFDGGVTWLPVAVRIDNVAGASSGQSVGPQIAAVGSAVSVAWSGSPFSSPSNNNDVYCNRSTDRGATWQPNDLRINTAVPAGGASTVLTDLRAVGGALFATWLDTFAGRGIRFNRSLDGGVTWLATDVGVNTPRSGPVQLPQRPRLAVAGTSVVVAWTNVVGSTRDVHCNRSMDAGTTWLVSDLRLNTGVPAGSSRAELRSLAFDGATPWAAWHDDRNGLNDIYINAAFGFVPYGVGTIGTGGVVPRAFGQGVALIGSTVDHRIDNALGGAPGLMAFGVHKDSIPLFGGRTARRSVGYARGRSWWR